MIYYAIKAPSPFAKEAVYELIAKTERKAWFNFFLAWEKYNPLTEDMSYKELKEAYQNLGYKCVSLRIDEDSDGERPQR